MKKLKRALCALLAGMIAVAATACSSGSQSSSTAASGTASETIPDKKLTIGLEADATTLLADTDVNATTDVQIRNIYEPLVDRDPETGKFVACLATSWKNVDDNTWDFTLRKDVKFSNGDPFNADAVKYSVEYILDKNNKSSYLSRWSEVKAVNVVNDYEIQIVTSAPYPTFLQRVYGDLLIMDPVSIKKTGLTAASTAPVGTGPYKVKEWKRNQDLLLTANENYWKGKPAITNVEYRYIPEFSDRLAAFLNGEIDLFSNVPVDSVDQVKGNANAKVASVSAARVDYVGFNTFKSGSPVQNEKVRQAINYAIDIPSLLKNVLNGYGTQITGPLATDNQDYAKTTGYPYDPDKAVSLLKEAGYDPSGITLTFDTPNGRYPMDKQVSQAIAAQLQKIGIKVKVNINEWASYLAKCRQRSQGDMYFMGWGPSYDGQTTIQNLFTKSAPYSAFYDADAESAINAADALVKQSDRKAAFAKIQTMLVEKAAWVPLWQQTNIYAVNKDLNFTPKDDESLKAYEMSWSK
jgi:peptide/nickel transport system substrate-binding protein